MSKRILGRKSATKKSAGRLSAFVARTYSGPKGTSLAYRLVVPPGYSRRKKYPVLLFLHGSGERGDDNLAQLKNVAGMFGRAKFQKRFPCFVVVPQCPEGESWADFRRRKIRAARPTQPMALALEIVDALRQEFRIDKNRFYVAGLSMGGFGVWDCLTRAPKRFAAAIVCCGGGRIEAVTRAAARVPVWVFHSADDGAVPIAMGREMVAALKKKSGEPRYTEYEAVGHNCWDPAFAEAGLLPWLFAQHLL